MPRFAASVALRIASGTSRALPWPKPTLPFWSPTTTSAAKPKRRPPFTTFATRLICTSLSTNSLSRSSRSRSRPIRAISSIPFWFGRAALITRLECQATFARRIGQGLDPTVIEEGAAIEHDLLHAFGGGAFGHELADRLGGLDIGTGFEAFAQRLLQRRRGRQRLA